MYRPIHVCLKYGVVVILLSSNFFIIGNLVGKIPSMFLVKKYNKLCSIFLFNGYLTSSGNSCGGSFSINYFVRISS